MQFLYVQHVWFLRQHGRCLTVFAVLVFVRGLGSQNQSQVHASLKLSLEHLQAASHVICARRCSYCSSPFHPQYALKSLYPASYTHIGQEFGAAVALDTSGALFVGAPNQLMSGQTERQNGAVHVLQLHSSPNDVTSHPSTALNSLAPLSKPVGTSCASLLQQVLAAPARRISTLAFPSRTFRSRRATLCPACTSSSPPRMRARLFPFTAKWADRAAGGACATPATV
jgi:hypothetical protein